VQQTTRRCEIRRWERTDDDDDDDDDDNDDWRQVKECLDLGAKQGEEQTG